MGSVPFLLVALGGTVLVAAGVSFPFASRGGRYRALPGWILSWTLFAALLAGLPRAPKGIALTVLGALMFVALREYFFLAPVRPQDRWAILVAYLAIPAVQVAVYRNLYGAFLAAVLLALFLVMPALLSVRPAQPGLFDSLGRVLLGLMAFVFCAGHLGWIATGPVGRPELFGILVLASELPQRLTGRVRLGESVAMPLLGIGAAAALGAGIAVWLAPLVLGLVLLGVGAALIGKGVNTLREHLYLVPEKTKQTLKEDKEWLRQKVT